MVRKAENKARGRACKKINLTGASAFVVFFPASRFLLDNATKEWSPKSNNAPSRQLINTAVTFEEVKSP